MNFNPQWRDAVLPMVLATLVALSGCHRDTGKLASGTRGSSTRTAGGTTAPAVDPTICLKAMDRRVPVIMYHDVIDQRTKDSVWFDCTTKEFEDEMHWIQMHDITPISVDQLYDHLTNGTDVPSNSICLTFDDNYQGFYDHAYPILKKYKYPAIMFVHTNFVGDKTGGHPKMDWNELNQLQKEGLITIGGHTQSHPEDITKIAPGEQEKEILGCRDILKRHMNSAIDYFAYPNGKNDAVSQGLAKKAGFKLAFTIDSGLAEESPNLYAIHRFERNKLEKAWKEKEDTTANAPVAVVQKDLVKGPVRITVGDYEGLTIGFATGGLPESVLANTRQGVPDFVRDAKAAAGINGGFFAMSGLTATSNLMIGPCYTVDKKFLPEMSPYLLDKLRNRPVIFWGPKSITMAPFQPGVMNTEKEYRAFDPDFTDLFLGGAWIIHNGIARTDEEMLVYASKDLADPRRRAFFGWNLKGEPVIGASLQTCSTERLAEAAAAAGVQEAILLDSGFSTSLVFDGRIIITGHTAKNLPSRPVPHAVVLVGDIDRTGADAMIALAKDGTRSPADIEGAARAKEERRRRRIQAAIDAAKPKPVVTTAPNPGDVPSTLAPSDTGSSAPGPIAPPSTTPAPGTTTTTDGGGSGPVPPLLL